MFRSSLLFAAFFLTCLSALAQWPGVTPTGVSDAQVAQLRSPGPLSVRTMTWKADFSRHTVEKGDLLSVFTTFYDENGRIVSEQTSDNSDFPRRFTSFVYEDGRLVSSAKYTEAEHDLVFQTFYSYDADSIHIRFTDGFQTVISRTAAHCSPTAVHSHETFADGEVVTRVLTYDSSHNLVRMQQSATDGTAVDVRLRNGSDGLPSKGVRVGSDGVRHQLTFAYEVDVDGNWTSRVSYVDGVAQTIEERTIVREPHDDSPFF